MSAGSIEAGEGMLDNHGKNVFYGPGRAFKQLKNMLCMQEVRV